MREGVQAARSAAKRGPPSWTAMKPMRAMAASVARTWGSTLRPWRKPCGDVEGGERGMGGGERGHDRTCLLHRA